MGGEQLRVHRSHERDLGVLEAEPGVRLVRGEAGRGGCRGGGHDTSVAASAPLVKKDARARICDRVMVGRSTTTVLENVMTTTTATRQETGLPVGTWQIDPVHSSLEFQVRNLGVVTVKGFFPVFAELLQLGGDGNPQAEDTVQVASVHT